ncbi:MAG: membrane-associated protein [Acidobacteria bacterium]|nr:MAG: membrane-associated protein [Acidobacteriota bacterium]
MVVPVYAVRYGPGNFLWFSDIALIGSVAALWLENPLLASTLALAVLLPELAWNVDFFGRLFSGRHLLRLARYMFDRRISPFVRGLSLFHVFLPVLLVWTVSRLGYDRRAVLAQTALCWIVLHASYLLTSPAENVNWVFGPRAKPQRRLHPIAYLAALMAFFPLAVYWPSHLVLAALFARD